MRDMNRSVGVIIVELRDRSKEGCSRGVFSATEDFDHKWTVGETTFLVRKEFLSGTAKGAIAAAHRLDAPLREKTRKTRFRIVSALS